MARNSSGGGSKTNGSAAKVAKKKPATAKPTAAKPAATKPVAQKAPTVKMVAHYTQDLSFENVAAREGRTRVSESPRIAVDIGMNAVVGNDNRHRVVMKIGISSKAGEQTHYLVELEYVGVFEIETENKALLHPILFIECPYQIFPFARRVAADAVRDGGYPPLLIDSVDFAGLYRREAAKMQAKDEKTKAAGKANK